MLQYKHFDIIYLHSYLFNLFIHTISENNFQYSILSKKAKTYVGRPVQIYMRITAEDKRAELSINRECDPADWNTGASRAKCSKQRVRG
jgi:hypothetical protein